MLVPVPLKVFPVAYTRDNRKKIKIPVREWKIHAGLAVGNLNL
jgi:hypothetical protein